MARLLIIEDMDSQREQARRVAESTGVFDEIVEAHDGLRGLKLLLETAPDVVLCDLEMPGLSGDKLLHARGSRPDLEDVAFLFLTATSDVDRVSRLLGEGACDAIRKPFHAADLAARLRLHLRVKQLQDELRAKNAALEELSTVDALTLLRNRRVADQALAAEVERARRHGTPLSILLADLDHFKRVNDEHGHPAGDAVLRGVSELLQAEMRTSDVAARYGGEELIAVLPHTGLDGAAVLAERWRQKIEDARFPTDHGAQVSVTVSIGVVAYDPTLTSPEQLIAAADRALYAAKAGGRNRVEPGQMSGSA